MAPPTRGSRGFPGSVQRPGMVLALHTCLQMARVRPDVVLAAALTAALGACTAFESGPDTGEPTAARQSPDGPKSPTGQSAPEAPASSASAASQTEALPAVTTDPEEACGDYLLALGGAALRCGDQPAARAALANETIRGPDCLSVKKVRDPNALYRQCLPWFSDASCADIGDPSKLPSACKTPFLE